MSQLSQAVKDFTRKTAAVLSSYFGGEKQNTIQHVHESTRKSETLETLEFFVERQQLEKKKSKKSVDEVSSLLFFFLSGKERWKINWKGNEESEEKMTVPGVVVISDPSDLPTRGGKVSVLIIARQKKV